MKGFVRKRMFHITTKRRGYTIDEYITEYNRNPKPFKPDFETARKRKATAKSSPSSSLPQGYVKSRKGRIVKA